MGNGISKVEAASRPAAEPVNIVITESVKNRWEAMYQQSKEKMEKEVEKSPVELQPKKGSDDNSTLDLGGVAGNGANVEKEQVAQVPQVAATILAEEILSFPSSSATVTQTESEKKQEIPSTEQVKPTTNVPKESKPIEHDNMGKISSYFVPRNRPSNREFDLESGNAAVLYETNNNCETKYSALMQQPAADGNPAFYEEVDETVEEIAKKKFSELIDEEAIFGNVPSITGGVVSEPSRSWIMKEVRVPKPILPVILDRDEDGKVTVETINDWKARERYEQKISQNNAYWSDELERITSKIEKETNVQADDFQRRIEQLRKLHSDVIEPPFRDGAHCNLLVPQIGKCYEQNENQVLKCSDLVRQFAQCTNKSG